MDVHQRGRCCDRAELPSDQSTCPRLNVETGLRNAVAERKTQLTAARGRSPLLHSKFAHLPDRSVVAVRGADAGKLLQGLVTDSLEDMRSGGDLRHAGLLTPQGKIQFEFFIFRWERQSVPEYFLDCASSQADDLIKRLGFYKLRAKVEIARAADPDLEVGAIWGGSISERVDETIICCRDPRLDEMGLRLLAPRTEIADISHLFPNEAASIGVSDAEHYHAHRIAAGIPEGGADYEFGGAFPHEAMWDQMGSVDFKKGCFIGQEVVSRMEHRGTARKRIVRITGQTPLQSGAPVQAGEATVGTLGSVSGNTGLATVRLDRVAEAELKGDRLHAGGHQVALELPTWVSFSLGDFAPKR